MSLSTDNTGYLLLGTCDDGIPTQQGVAFPPAAGQCKVTVKPKSGAKTKKSTASGKSGANTKYTGKNVGEFEVELEWLDDGEDTTAQMESALEIISPVGANAGKVWDCAFRWASIHGVGAMMIEDIEGPVPSKNSDEVSCKIKASGWTKPANSGAGAATQPTTATPTATPPTGALVNMPTTVEEMAKVVAAGPNASSAPTVTP